MMETELMKRWITLSYLPECFILTIQDQPLNGTYHQDALNLGSTCSNTTYNSNLRLYSAGNIRSSLVKPKISEMTITFSTNTII